MEMNEQVYEWNLEMNTGSPSRAEQKLFSFQVTLNITYLKANFFSLFCFSVLSILFALGVATLLELSHYWFYLLRTGLVVSFL